MSGRDEALRLMRRRDELEAEIEKTQEGLRALGAGVDEPLVTPDGFPRHDVDVASARALRVQLIRQQNDMKQLLDDIHTALTAAFPRSGARSGPVASDEAASGSASGSVAAASATTAAHPPEPKPFGVVKSVLSGSLGDAAGIRADDEIVRFGSARSLGELAPEFRAAAGRTLEIGLVRRGEHLALAIDVVPGRSLGCHIVPRQ